jgi:hypothetical protein
MPSRTTPATAAGTAGRARGPTFTSATFCSMAGPGSGGRCPTVCLGPLSNGFAAAASTFRAHRAACSCRGHATWTPRPAVPGSRPARSAQVTLAGPSAWGWSAKRMAPVNRTAACSRAWAPRDSSVNHALSSIASVPCRTTTASEPASTADRTRCAISTMLATDISHDGTGCRSMTSSAVSPAASSSSPPLSIRWPLASHAIVPPVAITVVRIVTVWEPGDAPANCYGTINPAPRLDAGPSWMKDPCGSRHVIHICERDGLSRWIGAS